MAFEQKWAAVPPQLFTANGGLFGLITVASTAGFKVKAKVVLVGTSLPQLQLQVKRVTSSTQMLVGPPDKNITTYSDVSMYTVAAGSYVFAEEQVKAVLKPDDILQALYDQEPAVALRAILVDQFGDRFESVTDSDGKKRLAVDAQVNVEVNSVALFTKPYDAIVPAYPSATQELYQSKVGGISGTNVQLVTVNYTDATKKLILNTFRINN